MHFLSIFLSGGYNRSDNGLSAIVFVVDLLFDTMTLPGLALPLTAVFDDGFLFVAKNI